jgi:hypothetical protein
MIKKGLLYILAICILAVCIVLPYAFSTQDEKMTLNHTNVENIKMNTKLSSNDSRLQFLLELAEKNGTDVFEYDGMSITINDEQINQIYQEISKIGELKDKINLTLDDVKNYQNCYINTYRNKDNSISILKISMMLDRADHLYCDFWLDSETYTIYQLRCFSEDNIKIKDSSIKDVYISYLGITDDTLINEYSIFNDKDRIKIMFHFTDDEITDISVISDKK